jgi:hypothetical protein
MQVLLGSALAAVLAGIGTACTQVAAPPLTATLAAGEQSVKIELDSTNTAGTWTLIYVDPQTNSSASDTDSFTANSAMDNAVTIAKGDHVTFNVAVDSAGKQGTGAKVTTCRIVAADARGQIAPNARPLVEARLTGTGHFTCTWTNH